MYGEDAGGDGGVQRRMHVPARGHARRAPARVCSYIWNTAANATTYTQLTIGEPLSAYQWIVGMMNSPEHRRVHARARADFKLFRDGDEPYKLRFFVGYDGTMIHLASLLGLGREAPLRWPELCSKIVMEVRWDTLGPKPGSYLLCRCGRLQEMRTLCV